MQNKTRGFFYLRATLYIEKNHCFSLYYFCWKKILIFFTIPDITVSCDISSLMCAFIVHVQPIVEYYSVIWSSSLRQVIECLEKVQRHFTKRLKGLQSMHYAERLRYLCTKFRIAASAFGPALLSQNCIWGDRRRLL